MDAVIRDIDMVIREESEVVAANADGMAMVAGVGCQINKYCLAENLKGQGDWSEENSCGG